MSNYALKTLLAPFRRSLRHKIKVAEAEYRASANRSKEAQEECLGRLQYLRMGIKP